MLWSVKPLALDEEDGDDHALRLHERGRHAEGVGVGAAPGARLGLDEVGDLGEEVLVVALAARGAVDEGVGEAGAEGAGGGRRALGARGDREAEEGLARRRVEDRVGGDGPHAAEGAAECSGVRRRSAAPL